MFKLSIITTVNIDQVKYDRNFLRVWKHAANPQFFTEAVNRFKHYANPVAYKLDGVYYIVNKFGSLESLLDLGKEEINLDIIDLLENDVIEFLLSFQYHEHKETRCMAELIKVTSEYIATPDGKKWLKTITKSDDKEQQFSELFDISKHATKCYLKLILPGNEKYLDMLAADKNYRPSKAYSDCLAEEKKPNVNDDIPSDKGHPGGTTKCKVPGKSKVEGTGSTPEIATSEYSADGENADQSTSSEPSSDQDYSSEDEYKEHLQQYEKGDSTPDEELPAKAFAQKVLVILSDGSQMELVGDIKLEIDGEILRNTNKLKKLPNGDWKLPSGFNDVSLTLVSKDNLWADF
jgi:hypothetical protein